MTNSKSTKSALIISSISLILCFAMLLGTTFAWFTDSVTSAGNIIKSGTLDVTMEWADGKSDPASATWTDASKGAIFNSTLWEPGYTEVRHIKIANKGTLALKYQLAIVANGEVSKLSDVIDVYYFDPAEQIADRSALAGQTAMGNLTAALAGMAQTANGNLAADEEVTITLALKMQESAGNEYQNLAIGSDFKVVLSATQLDAESDSFGKDYDEDSKYGAGKDLYTDDEGNYVAVSAKGLSSAAALASEDDSITSVKYVTDAGEVEVPVVHNSSALDSAIAADNNIVVIANGNYTVDTAKNTAVTIVGNGENTKLSIESEGEHNTDYGFDGSTVTFENLTFNVDGYLNGYARMNATYNNCIINGTYTLNGNSVFNNCTFNKTGDDYCIWTWGAPTAEFNNCTFNTDGKAILLYGGANTVLKLTGCTFNDSGVIPGKAAIETGSDWATDKKEIIITNCTVNGFDITEQKSLVWGGNNLGTNVWGNKNLLPTDRLNVVIDGVDVH